MLRPPVEALKTHKFQSATTILLLAFTLIVPCLTALIAASISDAAADYLRDYRPIVYLEPELNEARAEEIARELQGWSSVGEARLRSPDSAYELLQERLGEQEIAQLNMSPEMLPWSVEVVPGTPLLGHISLISDLAGLPVRAEVAEVDLPSAEAARALIMARWLAIFAAILLIALLFLGAAQTRIFLTRLDQLEARESALLLLFGAPPAALKRATITRGLTVGVAAGALSFAALLVAVLLWQQARPTMLGLHGARFGWAWFIMGLPLILGPLVGFLAAGFSNRRRHKRKNSDAMDFEILV